MAPGTNKIIQTKKWVLFKFEFINTFSLKLWA